MDDKELRQKAEKRVEEKQGFYWDIGSYIVVNAGLFLVWLFTGRGYPWFIWPLLGWGIGVIFHYLSVFAFGHGSWHERQVEKEMESMRRQNKSK